MERAALLGAAVIEKHFTLNKKMKGPDHKLSATPEELKKFSENLGKILKPAGKYTKSPLPEEKQGLLWGRRSLTAARDIKKGEIFNKKNILPLRPARGLPASAYPEIRGKKAAKNISQGQPLQRSDITGN